MPLTFHLHPGMVLNCDFNGGFKAPEMIKRRPVVVISPRPRRSNQLCTIVPSTGHPQFGSSGRSELLHEYIEPTIQRELGYRGIASPEKGYTTELLAWIELE